MMLLSPLGGDFFIHRFDFLQVHQIYRENTQNCAERPCCIFIFVGGRDMLNPAVPVYFILEGTECLEI